MSPSKPHPAAWFRCLAKAPSARLRLLIFPCAGASASSYALWAAMLPPTLEAYALQLPGRGDRYREPVVTDLPALIRDITASACSLADRPAAFFGHSLGALLAFETARELRRRGAPQPVHLFAAGRAAPQIPHTDPPLHQLPDAALIEEIRTLGGIPDEVMAEPELLELIVPSLRADLFIHETYQYREEPALTCPITALGGHEDHDVPAPALQAWQAQTSSQFLRSMFPGGHFFVHTEPQAVMRLLNERLHEPRLPQA